MKQNLLILLFFIITLFQANVSSCQTSNIINSEYKKEAIATLNQLMIDYYVFPEVAEITAKHLDKQFENGHFDDHNDVQGFASALTESVQSVNNDKHMRIRENRPYVAQDNTPERIIEEKIDRLNRSRAGNLGVQSVELLDGNVGYLDLRGFAGLNRGKAKVDSYMHLMAEADAIIVDLSKNGGGSPAMVQYLCSYFFDEKVHLNSLYWREADTLVEFWSLDEVGGKKMPEVPLFIITSSRTFSAAEEFSYNMQTRERATLVGETTGGGANPGGTRSINADLYVFIPTGRAVNPITNTNWEGVGVIPDIKVESSAAKDKAHQLAKSAAADFRKRTNEKMTKALTKLNSDVADYSGSYPHDQLVGALQIHLQDGFVTEADINSLGYFYLNEVDKPETAEALFYVNTKLHPSSPNVYDSYGEALMLRGKLKASMESYQKAVDIARENDDEDLEFYKENLSKVKKKLQSNR